MQHAATRPQVIIPQSRDGEAAKPREYCFVHYADRETAEKACAAAKEDGVKYDEASTTALTVGGWTWACHRVGWQTWLWCAMPAVEQGASLAEHTAALSTCSDGLGGAVCCGGWQGACC
jgi:hypothetical protein